jgi:hypothetical protein
MHMKWSAPPHSAWASPDGISSRARIEGDGRACYCLRMLLPATFGLARSSLAALAIACACYCTSGPGTAIARDFWPGSE